MQIYAAMHHNQIIWQLSFTRAFPPEIHNQIAVCRIEEPVPSQCTRDSLLICN